MQNNEIQVVLKGWKRFLPPARKKAKLAEIVINHAWNTKYKKEFEKGIMDMVLYGTAVFDKNFKRVDPKKFEEYEANISKS